MLLANDNSRAFISTPEQLLVQTAAQECNSTIDSQAELAECLLGFSLNSLEKLTSYSSLNNNGSPLQICISYGINDQRVRVIADPDAVSPMSPLRLSNAKKVLALHLCKSDADGLFKEWVQQTVNHWVPKDCHKNRLASGYFWLGTDFEQRGTALYLTPYWIKPTDQWHHLSNWLENFGIEGTDVIENLSKHARLASIALEGRTASSSKLKVYWRLGSQSNLSSQPHSLFKNEKLQSFIRESIGCKRLSTSGLLFSISWNISSRNIESVKIDLCGHCLNYTPAEWLKIVRRLSNCLDFHSPDIKRYFDVGAEIAFVSCSLDINGKTRFNIYWKTGSRNKAERLCSE